MKTASESESLASKLLDQAINSYLSLDPEMVEKIAAFKGRVIAIELLAPRATFYLLPQSVPHKPDEENTSDKVVMKVATQIDGKADTTLRGTPLALFKMGLASDVAPMMLRGEVEIDGDIRLGKDFKKVIASMDIDWEEHLSNLMGDMAASQAMSLARKISNWSRQSKDSLVTDLSEYLQEESRDVVSGAELEMFYNGVDRLRDDVDRLCARFEALKK